MNGFENIDRILFSHLRKIVELEDTRQHEEGGLHVNEQFEDSR